MKKIFLIVGSVLALALIVVFLFFYYNNSKEDNDPKVKKNFLTLQLEKFSSSASSKIEKKLNEIKAIRKTILEKQNEFERIKGDYQAKIQIVKEELLREQNKDDVDTFEKAIKNKYISNRLVSLLEYDAYLQEVKRRSQNIYIGADNLLQLERSFDSKLVMINMMTEEEIKNLAKKINQIIDQYLPQTKKLVIDTKNIKLKSKEELWKEIKSSKKNLTAQDRKNFLISEEICDGAFYRSSELTKINNITTECLCTHTKYSLDLSGLKNITVENIKIINKWCGYHGRRRLNFSNLESLSEELAEEIFVNNDCYVIKIGLKELPRSVAKQLFKFRGGSKTIDFFRMEYDDIPEESKGYVDAWSSNYQHEIYYKE